jgi:hypothetical protein
MHIARFRVQSYASFKDSGWIDLSPDFNLFVGQNNSGKSSLLRVLQPGFPSNPHKDQNSFRGYDLTPSTVSIDVSTNRDELVTSLRSQGLPLAFPASINDGNGFRVQQFLTRNSAMTIELELSTDSAPKPRGEFAVRELRPLETGYLLNYLEEEPDLFKANSRNTGTDPSALVFGAGTVFRFDAQRLNIGSSPLTSPERLDSVASNLPAVLAHLQGVSRPTFDRIESHLLDIVPGIGRITVAPRGQHFEILTWPVRESRNEELSFGLDASGTGVGQLLAILIAVVTSDQACIIVDDINSFLHPTAVKNLLSLLRTEYSHHQYIISTHSADAIAACNAERMFIVERDGFVSKVKNVNIVEARDAREVASTLGFSMMDVFGHDRMIWVEGPTEELCLLYLARKEGFLGKSSIGFAAVSATSGIADKNSSKRSVIDLYYNAARRLAPLLKGMAFSLDRETLTDEAVDAIERSKRSLKLLPRRCTENYVLNSKAIAACLAALDERGYDLATIDGLLQKNGGKQEYGAASVFNGNINDTDWLKKVDAPKLLSDVFKEASECRVEFRKTRDTITLLRYVYENDRDHLSDLVQYVSHIIELVNTDK